MKITKTAASTARSSESVVLGRDGYRASNRTDGRSDDCRERLATTGCEPHAITYPLCASKGRTASSPTRA